MARSARRLSLLVVVSMLAAAHAYSVPSVLRAYNILGGFVMLEPPRVTAALPAVTRALKDGCPCVRQPPGGKCCAFTAKTPPNGSADKAACYCRQCRASYKCVSHKSDTFCKRKQVKFAPRCVDPAVRTGASLCTNARTNVEVLAPVAAPSRQLHTRKVHPDALIRRPPRRRPPRRSRKRRRRRRRRRRRGWRRRRGRRPKNFDLFVAGHVRCWVYQGAGRRTILQTRREAKVYHSANVPLRRCAPIRLKCRDASRNRIGVMVALKANGRFYGTGIPGTRCFASARRPTRWHSENPHARDEKEVVRNMATAKETWQEMTELTGAHPIRAKRPYRSLFTYVVVVPPFCGTDFEGPVW